MTGLAEGIAAFLQGLQQHLSSAEHMQQMGSNSADCRQEVTPNAKQNNWKDHLGRLHSRHATSAQVVLLLCDTYV